MYKEYKHYIIIVILLLIIGVLVTLRSHKEIELVGIVKTISNVNDTTVDILVESNKEDKNNIVEVEINEASIIYRGKSATRISYKEITEGDIVEVIFKESIDKNTNPEKGVANAIRITNKE